MKNQFLIPLIFTLFFGIACNSKEDDPVIRNMFCKSEWQEIETIYSNGETKKPEFIYKIIFTTDGRVLGTQTTSNSSNASNVFYQIFKNGGIDFERGGNDQMVKYSKYAFDVNYYLMLTGEETSGKIVTTFKPIKVILPIKSTEQQNIEWQNCQENFI